MERVHGDADRYSLSSSIRGATTDPNLGNTIFLALSTANLPPGTDKLKWARSGISIISLMAGSLITSRIYNAVGGTRRLTLVLSFLIQTLCIVIAALLVQTQAVPETFLESKRIFIAIPFLAAQSGAQIVTAKSLSFTEIPTTVLTSIYNDLAGDPELWAWQNPKRDRRVLSIILMLLGGIAGGWLSRLGKSLTFVLWLGAGIKLLLTLLWLYFAADDGE